MSIDKPGLYYVLKLKSSKKKINFLTNTFNLFVAGIVRDSRTLFGYFGRLLDNNAPNLTYSTIYVYGKNRNENETKLITYKHNIITPTTPTTTATIVVFCEIGRGLGPVPREWWNSYDDDGVEEEEEEGTLVLITFTRTIFSTCALPGEFTNAQSLINKRISSCTGKFTLIFISLIFLLYFFLKPF